MNLNEALTDPQALSGREPSNMCPPSDPPPSQSGQIVEILLLSGNRSGWSAFAVVESVTDSHICVMVDGQIAPGTRVRIAGLDTVFFGIVTTLLATPGQGFRATIARHESAA